MIRRLGCGCGGCLGSVLLTLVVLVVLGYVFVYRPVQGFLTQYGLLGTAATATAAGQAAPAAQAAVTKGDVQRFVRVRRSVRSAVGSSFGSTEQVFRALQQGGNLNITQLLSVLNDATSVIGQARRAQQVALAKEQLSPARYAFIRAQVTQGLGVPDINFQQAASTLLSGRWPQLSAAVRPPDAQVRALIAPFRAELTATAPLGLLGL